MYCRFLDIWKKLYQNIGDTGTWEPVLGIACIVFLVGLRVRQSYLLHTTSHRVLRIQKLSQYLKMYEWGEPEKSRQSRREQIIKTIIWFCCTASNALVVLLSIFVAFILDKSGAKDPFPLTGKLLW